MLKDGTHNPPKRLKIGIPLLTGTMFGANFLDYQKATYISEEDYRSIHKNYSPQAGDIVITKIGTLGNVNILRDIDIPIAIHCNSAILRFPSNWGIVFPLLLCKSSLFNQRLRSVKGQSIQEFASLDSISSINIEIPTLNVIYEFTKVAEPLYNMMQIIEKEIISLSQELSFLLPLMMTGQV